jgi:hypothetical protein
MVRQLAVMVGAAADQDVIHDSMPAPKPAPKAVPALRPERQSAAADVSDDGGLDGF